MEVVNDRMYVIGGVVLEVYADMQIFNYFNQSNNEKWLESNSLFDKFKIIMQPCDQKTAIVVCQFIKSCFNMRKQKLYN